MVYKSLHDTKLRNYEQKGILNYIFQYGEKYDCRMKICLAGDFFRKADYQSAKQ